MKKLLSFAAAVMILIVSLVPVFAAESPVATATYDININPSIGGSGAFEFTTSIGVNGEQGVRLHAKPEDGYTFDHWEINGPYTTNGKLTDPELDIIIAGDISVTPYYTKNGTVATQPATTYTVKTDNSAKSPQTGSSGNIAFVVLSVSLIAAAVAVKFIKTSREK